MRAKESNVDYFDDEIMQRIRPIECLSIERKIKEQIDRAIEKIEKTRNELQESETRRWMKFTGIRDPLENDRVSLISHRPHTSWDEIKTVTDSIALDNAIQFTIYEIWHGTKVQFTVERFYEQEKS